MTKPLWIVRYVNKAERSLLRSFPCIYPFFTKEFVHAIYHSLLSTFHLLLGNPVVAADESTSGPAYLTLVDPDGNPILIDQHVPKPTKKE